MTDPTATDRPSWRHRPYGTGLLVGLALTCALAAVLYVGYAAGLPFIPFDVFDWVTRVLPGRLVIFGVETMSSVLQALGLNLKDTAKATENLMAVAGLIGTGTAAGLVFFALVDGSDRVRARLYGLVAGLALGLPILAIVLTINTSSTAPAAAIVIWILITFTGWGVNLGWSTTKVGMAARPSVAAPDPEEPDATSVQVIEPADTWVAEARVAEGRGDEDRGDDSRGVVRVDRRRFLIQLGGATAAITVVGATLGTFLKSGDEPTNLTSNEPPIPFPNEDSTVGPVPGTRPEYTPVADHYRIDINAVPPNIDGTSWRLELFGLVANPLTLSIDQIISTYEPIDQFITLSCVSNPVAGSLIGTTLWTGARFQDVLDDAGVDSSARFARVRSVDGFHETVALDLVRSEPRIMLAYNWNGQPLPREHGYPLRIYIPDHYGMKQPRWIEEIELVEEYEDGYWVTRGWDREATMKATSVIDVVAIDGVIDRGGERFVPVGGIAHAGARGISRVEVQVDEGDWQDATLREPLSDTTWVIWRYEWPFQAGEHTFRVRCTDGSGAAQIVEDHRPFPSGASGIHSVQAST
jgi:DMSO/TMAO reductase YedYZ molybdopterin-dependent catalytic subunit